MNYLWGLFQYERKCQNDDRGVIQYIKSMYLFQASLSPRRVLLSCVTLSLSLSSLVFSSSSLSKWSNHTEENPGDNQENNQQENKHQDRKKKTRQTAVERKQRYALRASRKPSDCATRISSTASAGSTPSEFFSGPLSSAGLSASGSDPRASKRVLLSLGWKAK